MTRRRPAYSMLTLVVAGFALVALPLLVAVVGGSIYVDRLSRDSERLVRASVIVARRGQALQTQLLQLERNARQYRIVGSPELAHLYRERQQRLLQTLDALTETPLPIGASDARESLRALSASVASAVARVDPRSDAMAAALERFARLHTLAGRIANAADSAIRAQLRELGRRSAFVRRRLFWLTIALFPITLMLTGLFAALILRPIRRLGRAIRGLGAVEPSAAIAVGGPPEIRELGVELERLRVRLARSEDEQNRFLRHISHELKTPLASIRESTELMADGTVRPGTSAHAEIVDILRDAGIELQQLIENLLVLNARGQGGHVAESIDPAALVDTAIRRHRLAIERSGLVIDSRADERAFIGLRALLQSALSNLIANAVRFSPAGGRLTVRARRRGARLILDVADEGPGIAEADRPHVFEPFYQGRASAHGGARGTGVGLSVVRDCARAHEGSVEIVTGDYPGAHIRVTLTARRRAGAGAAT